MKIIKSRIILLILFHTIMHDIIIRNVSMLLHLGKYKKIKTNFIYDFLHISLFFIPTFNILTTI